MFNSCFSASLLKKSRASFGLPSPGQLSGNGGYSVSGGRGAFHFANAMTVSGTVDMSATTRKRALGSWISSLRDSFQNVCACEDVRGKQIFAGMLSAKPSKKH